MADDTRLDYARLDRAIEDRAIELGLNFVQLAERAGISDVTLRNLRKGRGSLPRAVNLRRLENALGWVPGSLVATLDGHDPELVDERQSGEPSSSAERLRTLIAETQEELRHLSPKYESNRASLTAHLERRLADLQRQLKALQASE